MNKVFVSASLALIIANQCLAEEKILLRGKTFYGHEVANDHAKKWVEYFDVNGDGYYKSSSKITKSKWWSEGNKLCEKGLSPSDPRLCEFLRRNGKDIEVLDVKTGEVLSVIDKVVDGDAENLKAK